MSLYSKIIDLQKLHYAWKQVYKNKPKEGIDSVTCEEFEEEKAQQIKLLWRELVDHTYECKPVQLVQLYKGDKVRFISLYTMRDKVIQYSIAKELSALYDSELSNSCYAYRSGKSAMQAAQVIERMLVDKRQGYVLKTDIASFFDNILHSKMFSILRKKIKEEDVLDLISGIIKTPSLEKNGELKAKERGIYQGATIAPILSNIYMMDFDKRIEREVDLFVRYSDDILLFFDKYEDAVDYQKKINVYLEDIGLRLNENKTVIVSFDQGFEFLGYRFTRKGISVPEKAEMQLEEKLEKIWMDASYQTLEKRLEKASEVIGGWEQYYSGEREINSILEYAVWVYLMKKRRDIDMEKMQHLRKKFDNPYKDVALYLASIWKEVGMTAEALFEYEQYYSLADIDIDVVEKCDRVLLGELLEIYAKYSVRESEEIRVELIQTYSDLRMYRKAEKLLQTTMHRNQDACISMRQNEDPAEADILLTPGEMGQYMELFVGREDVYALDVICENGKRKCEEMLQPLLENVVKMHLSGKETVSTYIQRSNGTVKYLVLDLDVSKGTLLKCENDRVRAEYLNKCLDIAVKVVKNLRQLGISGYLEQSGCRGYHIWIFFTEWLPVRYANLLSDVIEQKTSDLWKEEGIQLEIFPNKTKLRNGKKGQAMKLPWGVHPKTGKKSCFLDQNGQYFTPQKALLQDTVRLSRNAIKRIISANQMSENSLERHTHMEVDTDLTEFGMLDDSVRTVLESCNLMRYLVQKARKTQYLSHFERLTLLYVFGHLGDPGKEFLHKIMEFTLNYSYNTTQKFILRCPEKPISCLKLREQYKQISAEIGCTCAFKRTKNCYPSPVLHALKKAEGNSSVTMPLSRSVPADRQKILMNEINAASKVQSIAEKMLELKKQKRNLDKSIKKCEQELMEIFDDGNTDSMEIKMGLLVRRKNGDKTEWVIEL